MGLDEYRRKRRAGKTTEPLGVEPAQAEPPAGPTREGVFVVHLHDATRRHYDLRIEMGGALASFAVPKGPSLDPETRHLAVHTEDHPLEYLDFEGIIPDGEYGAGPMIAWDRGHVTYLEDGAEPGVAKGKIDFVLRGFKLRGRFALVRLKNGERDWLLFKKRDEHASAERDLLTELPLSVFSGLGVDELANRAAIAERLAERATELGGARAALEGRLGPMEGAPGALPKAGAWCYELLLDGARVLARREGEHVVLATASGDVAQLLPEVTRALRALYTERVVLDATLVAFAPDGRPSLERLVQRLTRARNGELGSVPWRDAAVTCLVSDVLAIEGVDVRGVPLEGRKGLVTSLLPGAGVLRAVSPVEGDPETVLAFCRQHGLEGLVAKKKGSRYEHGPSASWVTVRCDPARPAAPRFETLFRPEAPGASAAAAKSPHRVVVTNRAKVFWPDDGLTKGDLCDYYEAIAPAILPYLRDRPIALVRHPDGIAGKSFFQWNVPPALPSWVRTFELPSDEGKGGTRVFLLEDAASLLYVANMGCIPLHMLACRSSSRSLCDFFTIDFDVKASSLDRAVVLARTLRGLLKELGLHGYPKTSGQSGLHVLVPLGEGQSFTTARALADLLGRLLVTKHPDIATMERRIEKRGPRVYVDTGQTGASRTIVSPYSVRAWPGAPVSMPLEWDEVTASLDPRAFTIRTGPSRYARLGDPMRRLLDEKPDVAKAVGRLEKMLTPRA